jgi:hypothetical protein
MADETLLNKLTEFTTYTDALRMYSIKDPTGAAAEGFIQLEKVYNELKAFATANTVLITALDTRVTELEARQQMIQRLIFYDTTGTQINNSFSGTPVATGLVTGAFTPKSASTNLEITAACTFATASTETGVKTKIFAKVGAGAWTAVPVTGSADGGAADNQGAEAGNQFNVITKSNLASPGISDSILFALYFYGNVASVNVEYRPDLANAWISVEEFV